MNFHSIFSFVLFLAVSCNKPGGNTPPVVEDKTFSNPLLVSGPDPWVVQKDGTYYYTHTFGNRVAVFKTQKITDLGSAPVTTIWTPPTTGAYSKNIWAPELHFINGKWYTYFAADDGQNKNHRLYVLENAAADPTTGNWEFKGKISDPTDKWAIDGSVFEHNGQMYFLWSGWEGDVDVRQDIYIAKMSNPWTITGNRVMISTPTFEWEKIGNPDVNEGPQVFKNPSGKVFMTYSASGCWTDDYSLGLLSLKAGGDPMNPADWTKSPTPVFAKKPENNAYAPGHNGFFKSKDGSEDWIIYHANSLPNQGCTNSRNPRIQKFTWNADGTPNFGEPVKTGVKIQKPSGE
ncbi:MAG TPA: glycoside hydrolase family 43 protein [Flavisolibacter sp.]|nr:glycoside hydrolase family 43 protein [Flavisolibacter sp.]